MDVVKILSLWITFDIVFVGFLKYFVRKINGSMAKTAIIVKITVGVGCKIVLYTLVITNSWIREIKNIESEVINLNLLINKVPILWEDVFDDILSFNPSCDAIKRKSV